MTPLNQRRWQNFKNNKRGFFSFWIFSILFIITMCSPWIANDKPLLIFYQNQFYFPIHQTYSEVTFGGDFDLEMDYRQSYAKELISKNGWAIWPLIRYNYDTIDVNGISPASPSFEHLLGTDDQGRDVLSRVLYGFRLSVLFGLLLSLFSSIIGIFIGAIQGFFAGHIDLLGQRFIEVWASIPVLYLIMIVSSFIQPSFGWLLLILILFHWMSLVDVVRAECLRVRNFEYIRAAKALGMSNQRIIIKHVLPNAMIATITFAPFLMTSAVGTLTSLDFLGFGLPLGSPSLGELIRQGKNNLHAPWLGITAFMVISIMLTLFVFIGEAVRDAIDPRKYNGTKT